MQDNQTIKKSFTPVKFKILKPKLTQKNTQNIQPDNLPKKGLTKDNIESNSELSNISCLRNILANVILKGE